MIRRQPRYNPGNRIASFWLLLVILRWVDEDKRAKYRYFPGGLRTNFLHYVSSYSISWKSAERQGDVAALYFGAFRNGPRSGAVSLHKTLTQHGPGEGFCASRKWLHIFEERNTRWIVTAFHLFPYIDFLFLQDFPSQWQKCCPQLNKEGTLPQSIRVQQQAAARRQQSNILLLFCIVQHVTCTSGRATGETDFSEEWVTNALHLFRVTT